MATSGSYDYNLNTDQIITGAYEDLGVLGEGQSLSSEQLSKGKVRLNTLLKNLAGEGVFLWDLDVVVYALSSSSVVLGTDSKYYECTRNHTSSTDDKPITGGKHQSYWVLIASSASAWATSTAYTLDTIVTNGGNSYICIKAHTSGDTDDEPGVGATTATYWNAVSTWATSTAYTSRRHQTNLDTNIIGVYSMILREGTKQTPLEPISIKELDLKASAGDATSKSEPTHYMFRRKSQPEFMFYPFPDSSSDYVLEARVYRQREDMDSTANNPDFLSEWLRPLRLLLAVDLAPSVNRSKGEFFRNLKSMAEDAKRIAKGMDEESGDVQFEVRI